MVTTHVVVGTKSPLKLHAVREGFSRICSHSDLTVEGVEVISAVSQQPVGFEEIYTGALHRATETHKQSKGFSVGIESGLIQLWRQWYDVCTVVILPPVTASTERLVAHSIFFPVPSWAAALAQEPGNELGKVVQKLSGGGEKDAQAHFSAGQVRREDLIADTVEQALFPLRNRELYEEK